MKIRISVLMFFCFLIIPAFGQESENFAFLTLVQGRVLLQEEQAKKDQYILKDDWLVTDKGGRAEIRFGENGGYLIVDENSKIFFVELSPAKTVIAAFQGSVSLKNLEKVELRAAGKPEGKVIIPEKEKIIHVGLVDGKVEVEEQKQKPVEVEPVKPEPKPKPEPEPESKPAEKQPITAISNYYPYSYWPYFWRWYSLYFCWYPGWYYPMYYYLSNYGYYYNSYGWYGGGGSVVRKGQLQSRRLVRPSRTNSFVSPTRTSTSIRQFPSRIPAPTPSSIRPTRTISSIYPTRLSRPVISRSRSSSSPSRVMARSPISSFKPFSSTISRGISSRGISRGPSLLRSPRIRKR